MGDVTPPPLQAPSSKEKKYDRQLRLWAASGQAALEEAHVLLVNSGGGAVGVETLKNLVLPGKTPELLVAEYVELTVSSVKGLATSRSLIRRPSQMLT